MRWIIFILFFSQNFTFIFCQAQFVYKIKADSVLITNDSCTAELIIENSTKNVRGFLVNKGNGRTEFRWAQQLTDSSFIIAGDTVVIRGTNSNPANIYNSNGILTANRTVTLNNNKLTFDKGSSDSSALTFEQSFNSGEKRVLTIRSPIKNDSTTEFT